MKKSYNLVIIVVYFQTIKESQIWKKLTGQKVLKSI